MRLLGAGLIWASLILTATVYSADLKKRVMLLSSTIIMISQIKIQLEYLNMPVCDIIRKLCTNNSVANIEFLSACDKLISSGVDFPVAWESSVVQATNYKTDEKRELLQLGANLGTSNKENQIEIIHTHKKAFELFESKAKEKEQRYAKLSVALAALIGCMFFITVI